MMCKDNYFFSIKRLSVLFICKKTCVKWFEFDVGTIFTQKLQSIFYKMTKKWQVTDSIKWNGNGGILWETKNAKYKYYIHKIVMLMLLYTVVMFPSTYCYGHFGISQNSKGIMEITRCA